MIDACPSPWTHSLGVSFPGGLSTSVQIQNLGGLLKTLVIRDLFTDQD